MRSGDLLRIARRRAGLTQEQLGTRTGIHRTSIARWETGARGLTLEMLNDLVEACDLDLVIHLARWDQSLEELVEEQLVLDPIERLARLVPPDELAGTLDALRWISGSRVPAIVIGSVGAILQGAPQRASSGHVEVVSGDPAATERELEASGFQPIDDADRWATSDRRMSWTLARGTLVVGTDLAGTTGYRDLRRDAAPIQLDRDVEVTVAHPRDLLRIGDASPRETERARVPGLRALLTRRGEADPR